MFSFLLISLFYFSSFAATNSFAKILTNCDYERRSQNANFNYNCTCLQTKTCIRKCCSEYHEVFSEHNYENCVEQRSTENIWERNSTDGDLTDVLDVHPKDLHLMEGFPCKNYYALEVGDNFTLFRNGTLITPDENPSEYCLEYVRESGRRVAFICVSPDVVQKQLDEHREAAINSILLWVSMSFLLITFFVYAVVPRLRNLKGKCLLCYLLSTMSYSLLFGMVLKHSFQGNTIICEVVAYVTQYTALASFFWLNIMGFDLWMTVRKIRPHVGSTRKREIKKFVLYSVYAWGSPLIVSGVTFLVEFSDIPFPKPSFGTPVCWFENETAKRWYFYSIMTVLVIANVIMFINTTYFIFAIDRKWKEYERKGSQRHSEQQKKRIDQMKFWRKFNLFILYIKISLIMGLNWTAELLSQHIKSEIWRLTDIANLLQGVFLFIIFVCKKSVLIQLNKRLCPSRMFIKEPLQNATSIRTLSTTNSVVSYMGSTRKKSLMALTPQTSLVASPI